MNLRKNFLIFLFSISCILISGYSHAENNPIKLEDASLDELEAISSNRANIELLEQVDTLYSEIQQMRLQLANQQKTIEQLKEIENQLKRKINTLTSTNNVELQNLNQKNHEQSNTLSLKNNFQPKNLTFQDEHSSKFKTEEQRNHEISHTTNQEINNEIKEGFKHKRNYVKQQLPKSVIQTLQGTTEQTLQPNTLENSMQANIEQHKEKIEAATAMEKNIQVNNTKTPLTNKEQSMQANLEQQKEGIEAASATETVSTAEKNIQVNNAKTPLTNKEQSMQANLEQQKKEIEKVIDDASTFQEAYDLMMSNNLILAEAKFTDKL